MKAKGPAKERNSESRLARPPAALFPTAASAGKPPARFDEGSEANAAAQAKSLPRNRFSPTLRAPRDPCSEIAFRYTPSTATITEVEKLAFDLPDSERAVLAAHLLRSLPSVLHDDDEGIAEALRRDAELDANPEAEITLDQLDQQIKDRRR